MYDVRVVIDGRNFFTWDVLTGGETDSTELTYKPGAMANAISLGGSVTVGQVILNKNYDLQRDTAQIHWLLSRVGKGTVVIHKQPLDVDGNVYGKPLVYTGILKRVTPPEVDANATDAALIEIEVTPQGLVT
jgi:hypothetical protein